ncbi:hypothetical protein M1116_01940 [Patescibacteria group bacterium]|nr:hypothetical protein [Patescibacteria group bacterium]
MGILRNLIRNVEPITRATVLLKNYQTKQDQLIPLVLPVLNDYDKEKRAFLTTISIVSAAVGAFSFLLYNSPYVKNPDLLKLGDILILLTIILSIVGWLVVLHSNQKKLHDTFCDLIDSLHSASENLDNYIQQKISQEDFEKKLQSFNKEYKRPNFPDYYWQIGCCILFVTSLVFIALSFFT